MLVALTLAVVAVAVVADLESVVSIVPSEEWVYLADWIAVGAGAVNVEATAAVKAAVAVGEAVDAVEVGQHAFEHFVVIVAFDRGLPDAVVELVVFVVDEQFAVGYAAVELVAAARFAVECAAADCSAAARSEDSPPLGTPEP